MAAREPEPLLGTSHFRVLIGERELGFSAISGLTSRTDPLAVEAVRARFDTVVLRRGLTRSNELYEWRRRVASGTADRRDVTIQQLDAAGGSIVNAWTLVHAWPCRWSGPAFNSLENTVAYEEVELAFDDLVWLEEPSRPRTRPSPSDDTTEGA
jgi:phage tail-like protein